MNGVGKVIDDYCGSTVEAGESRSGFRCWVM